MFLVALAAAAASPHSVTGAFGYVLGQAPPAKVATCNKTWLAKSKVTVFFCPGDGFFSSSAINTERNQVTIIIGYRRYPATQPGALTTCLTDLGRYEAKIKRDNPALAEAQNKSATFDLSEGLIDGRFPRGRTIVGHCSPSVTGKGNIVLYVAYSLAVDEAVRLRKLNQAEAGK